jgi:hypothetical protein
MNRGWLVVTAALAVSVSVCSQTGGDNGMNPCEDSYAALRAMVTTSGRSKSRRKAHAAHEMDGQTTPLMDQMRQTQAAIAARTIGAERMGTALEPQRRHGAAPSSTAGTSQPATDSGYGWHPSIQRVKRRRSSGQAANRQFITRPRCAASAPPEAAAMTASAAFPPCDGRRRRAASSSCAHGNADRTTRRLHGRSSRAPHAGAR